jgi:phenylalanyl-tRNA synthetase alpha chain
MPAVLTSAQLARDLAITDLSDPAEGPPHAIQMVAELAVSALTSAWGCPARWCRGPRVVTIADNYDRLGYLASAVTREARYTRYVDDRRVLRSHSTAMVPPALRLLAEDPDPPDDVLLVCPGIVYRRDAIDWQHSPAPHQLDLWRVSRKPLGEADMNEMVTALLGALAPGRESLQHRRDHPYTTAGRQIDVAHAGGWVEVWECGLAARRVLAGAGLSSRSGLALGMGLDRLLMLLKGIPDIRLLRSADARVASQMLGDRIRDALGADADAVEDVAILSSTAPEDLPGPAAARLGARPGQRNLLVRVVLRHLERTLTDEEANSLRDRIYAAIHQGTRHQWAAAQRPRAGRIARASGGAGPRP